MLLLKLRIRDFLIYGEVDIDLSKIKLASIIGQYASDRRRSNGAGKTALLEAIRYALYDQTRSKNKLGIVRHGAKNSLVELEFMVGGKRCRIARNRAADGTSAAKFWIDGREAGDKIKIVNDAVIQTVGVDADLFDQIYFFKQGDQFGFTEATPSDRKAALARIFKMDSINRCYEIAKQKKSEAELDLAKCQASIDTLEGQLGNYDNLDNLLEQEFNISSDFATAMQLRDEYASIDSDNTFSRMQLELSENEFNEQIDDDLGVLNTIQSSINIINSKIVSLQQSCQSTSAALDKEQQTIDRLNAKIDLYKIKPITKKALEPKLEAIHGEIDGLSNKAAVLKSDADRLRKVNIKEHVGAECPVCKQFVSTDHFDKVKSHTLGELARVEGEWSAVNEALQRKKIEYIDTKKAIEDSETYYKIISDIDMHKQILDVHRDVLNNNEPKLEELISERNQLFAQQALATQRSDTTKINLMRAQLKPVINRINKLFTEVGASRYAAYNQEVDRLMKMHADIKSTIKNLSKIYSDLELKKGQLAQCSRDVSIYTHLTDAFSKNGIQALMIDNAVGVIEAFANDILKQMQTKFTIGMKTLKETKAGDLRESLDIIVYDNGFDKPFENYSGGERAMINIAVRLALSKVISSLHGVQMHSLFLDEVLGSLDSVNREEVVKVISYLSRSFEQVFIVSHTDEVKDVIDSAIIIERSDDSSTIKLTHG